MKRIGMILLFAIFALSVSAALEITNAEDIPTVYTNTWKDGFMLYKLGLWLHVVIPINTFVGPFVTLYIENANFESMLWAVPIWIGEFAIYLTMSIMSLNVTPGQIQKNTGIEKFMVGFNHFAIWILFGAHIIIFIILLVFYNTVQPYGDAEISLWTMTLDLAFQVIFIAFFYAGKKKASNYISYMSALKTEEQL